MSSNLTNSSIIDLKSTKIKTSTGTSKTTVSDVKIKDKPSLFDNLLGVVKSKNKTVSKEVTKAIFNKEIKKDTVKIVTKTKLKNISQPSLLDKLLIDAKVTTKDTAKIKQKVKEVVKTDKEKVIVKEIKGTIKSDAQVSEIIKVSKEPKVLKISKESKVLEKIAVQNNIIEEPDNIIKIAKELKIKTKVLDQKLVEDVKPQKSNEKDKISKIKITVKEEFKEEVKPKNTTKQKIENKNKSDLKVSNTTKEIVNSTKNNKTIIKESLEEAPVAVEEQDIKNKSIEKEMPKEKVNIKSISKQEVQPSLFDMLTSENKNVIKEDNTIKAIKNIKVSSSAKKDNFIDQIISQTKDNQPKKYLPTNKTGVQKVENTVQASMFLSSQKNAKEIGKNIKIQESTKNIINTKSVEGIEKSAKVLELNPSEIKIETQTNDKSKIKPQAKPEARPQIEPENKTENIVKEKEPLVVAIKTTVNTLNKMAIINNSNLNNTDKKIHINALEHIKTQQIIQAQTQSNDEGRVVELQVGKSVEETIQTKIIGAKQKLGNFMSEVARNMYLNYKPPVTAFKINLNPANLGGISIVMKSNKVDKSMSVSMNMTSTNTLEAFIDNKATLQIALQKTFTESSSSISLDFGMQDNSSKQSFEQSKQEQNKNIIIDEEENSSSFDIAEDEDIQSSTDYM